MLNTDELIYALNPDGTKQGVRIEKSKYDVMRASILDVLQTRGAMPFSQLAALVNEQLHKLIELAK